MESIRLLIKVIFGKLIGQIIKIKKTRSVLPVGPDLSRVSLTQSGERGGGGVFFHSFLLFCPDSNVWIKRSLG